jgi:PAS domain S-box-containing protein
MLFTFVDLSGRQKAEDERRKSEANFATLMRITPDPVLVITQAGHLVRQANTAFLRTTGLAEAELSGKMLGALPIWEDDAAGCELEAKLQEQDELQPCRVTLRGRDGRAVQHRISTAAIQLGDEACLLLVAQDVAEQSRTEAEIVAAIEAVMKDTAWFMQAVREKMAITRRPPSTDTVEIDKISRRVRQVLDLVCGGLADAEIARELHISRNTVRNHVMSLYRITGVHSRTGLVIWAHERGITSVTAEKPKDPPGS